MSRTEIALGTVFRRQHGAIAVGQALHAGLTRTEITNRVAAGRWHRFARGVFTLNGAPATFAQRVTAVCLAVGGGTPGRVVAASHTTAEHLLLRGRGAAPTRVDVTIGVGRSARSVDDLDVTIHRSRHLSSRDVVLIDRIPVTKPARLLADMSLIASQAELDDLVDEVFCRFPRLAPRRLTGLRPKLDSSIAPWLDGPRPESVPEIALQRRLIEGGLPSPLRQFVITDPETGAFVARVDLAYPAERLAIEYDGALAHAPRYTERDRERTSQVSTAGWRTLTATVEDADRATCAPFVDAVRAALDETCPTPLLPPARSLHATTRRAAW